MRVLRADSLRSKDFELHPIWQIVDDDKATVIMVKAVREFPVKSLKSKLVKADLILANGSIISGYAGNVNQESVKQNQHFLALSFFGSGRVFHLARYFDDDYHENGPNELAKFLSLSVKDIFPLSYDFTRFHAGRSRALKGVYPAEVKDKLSLLELAMFAVPTPTEVQDQE